MAPLRMAPYVMGTHGQGSGGMGKLMDRDPDDFDHVTDRVGHDLRYAIDSTALRQELGWVPQHTDFTEGLRATIDWYRANEWWWGPCKAEVEARYTEWGQ